MMRELRWRQIVISFLLGIVLTAGIFHFRLGPWMRPDPKARYEHMLNRFSRKLRLSDEQQPKVAAIFEIQRQKIDLLRGEVEPRFDEVRKNAGDEIRRLLTPDQQSKFDQMETDHSEMRKRRHDKGFSPPKR